MSDSRNILRNGGLVADRQEDAIMDDTSRHARRVRLDRGNLRDVIVVLSLASVFFFPLSTAMLVVGLTTLAAGCALHVLVKGQLIRNTTLCTEGAYAVVRHPYYLANYLIDTSFCLLGGNVFLAVLYPFLFFLAYGPTFREEETRLASLHGERFAEYCNTAPQVFPEASSLRGLPGIAAGFSWRRITTNEMKRLTRFSFLASLLVLAQHVRAIHPDDFRFWESPMDHATFAMAALCALLLVASLAIPRRRHEAEEGEKA
jgi:protein-S-isoprenylcysteine O-methyltransferase Ste14